MQSRVSGMSEASLFQEFGINNADLDILTQQGISKRILFDQLYRFKFGFQSLQIDRPADLGDGVYDLAPEELETLQSEYQNSRNQLTVCKFVPASGAASRMFKDLQEFLNNGNAELHGITHFIDNLENFAFYQQLKEVCPNIQELIISKNYNEILEFLLTNKGLNYRKLPKALLYFYQHPEGPRMVLEEHLEEAGLYATSNDKARIHFTVSPEHLEAFQRKCDALIPMYNRQYRIQYEITLSVQAPSTNTVAIGPDGSVFRNENNEPHTRPGGHGSLLSNLNRIDADLIFVKNVDNITPPGSYKDLMVKYKKAMAGLLIKNQQLIFEYIQLLDDRRLSDDKTVMMTRYLRTVLGLQVDEGFQKLSIEERKRHLRALLNRPLRICSVIRTDKPTGGGPYWIKEQCGDTTIQIVEGAQIAPSQDIGLSNTQYAHITDMVCAVKDYQGNKFDLSQYVDQDAGFITEKFYQGEHIKVLEHPGLWNGSMSRWNTILFEIPDTIFYPVKSVWDLLNK